LNWGKGHEDEFIPYHEWQLAEGKEGNPGESLLALKSAGMSGVW
jgi:hypothetical protein